LPQPIAANKRSIPNLRAPRFAPIPGTVAVLPPIACGSCNIRAPNPPPRGSWKIAGVPARALRLLLAAAAGMVVIHLGGSAQLAILTGNAGAATRYGLIPFLTGDLLKIGIAALLILALGPAVRRRI